MPTWIEQLEATLDDNCRRIADLCNERSLVLAQYEADFAACTSIEQLLQLSVLMSERTTLIDAEIELLSRGSKKLLHQMEVA